MTKYYVNTDNSTENMIAGHPIVKDVVATTKNLETRKLGNKVAFECGSSTRAHVFERRRRRRESQAQTTDCERSAEFEDTNQLAKQLELNLNHHLPLVPTRVFGRNGLVPIIDLTGTLKHHIVYSAANNIVIFNHIKGQQTILQGHRNQIAALCKDKGNKYLASGDIGPKSTVIIWDILEGSKHTQINSSQLIYSLNCAFKHEFVAPILYYLEIILDKNKVPCQVLSLRGCHGSNGVTSIDFVGFTPYVGVLGAERQNKQVVSIWSYFSQIPVVEPICQFNIPSTLGYQHEIVFHPEKNNCFVTTGHRGVAFYTWKLPQRKIYCYEPKLSKAFLDRMKKFTRSIWSSENSCLLTSTMAGYVIVWDITSPLDLTQPLDSNRNVVEFKRCFKIGVNGLTSFTQHNGIYIIGDTCGVVHFYDMQFRLLSWTRHKKLLPVYFVAVIGQQQDQSAGAMRLYNQNGADRKFLGHKENYNLTRNYKFRLADFQERLESTFDANSFEYPDLFIGVADGTVYFYGAAEERLDAVVQSARGPFVACDVNQTSNHLALVTRKGEIHLYDTKTHRLVHHCSLFKKQTRVSFLKFHPTGSFAFVGSSEGKIFCRRAFDWQPIGSTLENSRSSIDNIVISEGGTLMAFQDSSRAVGLYANSPLKSLFGWTFKGKRRMHCKDIVDILFYLDVVRNVNRLFSLGADRRIIEYDTKFGADLVLYSSLNDGLGVLTITRVEQHAIPRAMATAHFSPTCKLHICISNSNYEMSVYDPDNQNIMRICWAPMHEASASKIVNITAGAGKDGERNFTIFVCGNKLGLAKRPFEGIPYKYMAVLAHPTGVKSVSTSRDHKSIYSIGNNEITCVQWRLNPSAIEHGEVSGGPEGCQLVEITENI